MATTLQLRRGSAAEAAVVVGSKGELFIDTENNNIHLLDGETAGGTVIGEVDTSNLMSNFTVESGGVDKILSNGNHLNIQGGNNISVGFTTSGIGSESDPYDLSISHADTSSASSQNNTGTNKFIQTLLIDGNGHVTGVQTKDLLTDYRLVQKDLQGNVTLNAGKIETFTGRDYVEETLKGAAVSNFPSDGQILSYENDSLFWIDPPAAAAAEEPAASPVLMNVVSTPSVSYSTVIDSPTAPSTTANSLVIVGGYPNFDANMSYCCWNDTYSNNSLQIGSNTYSSYTGNNIDQNGMPLSYSSGGSAAGFVAYVDGSGWNDVHKDTSSGGSNNMIVLEPATMGFSTEECELYVMARSNSNFGDGSMFTIPSGVTLDFIEYSSETGINFMKFTVPGSLLDQYTLIEFNYYTPMVYTYIYKGAY